MNAPQESSSAAAKTAGQTPSWVTALVTMVAVQMATAFLSRIPPTLAPALAMERGWSDAVVGYLASLNTLGSILFLVLGAPFLHRLGSVRALQGGLVLGILGLVLLLPPVSLAAGLASLLIGLGYGPSSPAGNDILHRTAPPNRRAMIFSIKQAGVPIGGIVAGVALAPIAEAFGWRISLLAAGAFVLVVILCVQPMRAGLDADRKHDQSLALRTLFSPTNLMSSLSALTASTSLLRLGAAGACMAVGQGVWFAYLMTFAVSELGYSLSAAGVVFAIMQAASVVGRVLLGWLADRLGQPRRLLALIGLASGLTSLAMAFVGPHWSYPAFCALAAVAGITVSSWNGVQLSEIARASPAHLVREASAGATLIIFLGYVFAPAIFALVLTATGRFDLGFLLAACFGVACLVIMRNAPPPRHGDHKH
ncbi:MFS transporter [Bosea sp. 124]|uniref:MFS transporter n=1 Tax=Bosea sp. 124 TaxID=2135642 RepID=UPI000D4BD325|nr:MFS transporter [Bosea sp. 124]PTM41660.1 putative MFS family arabinose efflux permease [Bosea sp. 124]